MRVLTRHLPEYFGTDVPSHQTILNWIECLGLKIYSESCALIKGDYCIIFDESITIGSQKLLLILGVPAQHLQRPLRHCDVQVLGMYVSANWKAEDIAAKLNDIVTTIGYKPQYVLSDEGHNLVNACQLAELPHHKDVSHAVGNMLKHTYQKDEEFVTLTTEMGKKRLTYHLTDKGYLLPPNQRSICRFMNMFDWVDWAYRINHSTSLTDEERKAFSFVKDHSALVDELYTIMGTVRYVEREIKQHGLSYRTANDCIDYVLHSLVLGAPSKRMLNVGTNMCLYLFNEARLLPDEYTAHQLSSDIIESTFGYYKERKSPNNLNGVTAFALIIPTHTKMCFEYEGKYNCQQALESITVRKLGNWKQKNLLTNWVTRRHEKLYA